MSIVRSSLIMSFVDKYAVLVINIVSTMILARKLTPVETGVFSVAWSLINIAQALREFGIIGYIVQEKELTKERLGTAFTISVALGTVLTIGFALSADAFADFYKEPRMKILVEILSFNFIVVSVAAMGTALLQRAMNFSAMMRINIVSALVNATVSVGLVYQGYGPIALAWSSLLGTITIVICNLIYVGRQLWLRPSIRAWRRIGEFGVLSSGAALLSVTSSRAAELAIGRLLSLGAAGIFSRGSGLITLFQQSLMNAIMPVTGAALARLHREDSNVRGAFLDAMSYVTGAAWPFLAMMALLAEPVITIFYGPQWLPAIPIARILCLATAIAILGNLTIVLFNAAGAVRRNFVIQLVTLPVSVIAVVVGSLFDLKAAALGVVVASLVSTVLAIAGLNRKFGTSWFGIAGAVSRSLLVTAASALVPAAVSASWGFADGHLWPATLVAGFGGGLSWLAALRLVSHPLWDQLMSLAALLHSKMATAIGG